MPIAGIVILTAPGKADSVLSDLQALSQVTTYGIHKENNIVAVLETDTPAELKILSASIQDDIPGVMGVYASNVNYEDLDS